MSVFTVFDANRKHERQDVEDKIRVADETQRILAVRRTGLLDKDTSLWFRGHVAMAKTIGRCMLASVSLFDEQRCVFLSHNFPSGLDATEVPRKHALGNLVIRTGEMEISENLREDPRFEGNPFVSGPPGFVFWAAWPIRSTAGDVIGALELADLCPRTLDQQQIENLSELARQVERQIALYEQTGKQAQARVLVLMRRLAGLEHAPGLSAIEAFIRLCGGQSISDEEAGLLRASGLLRAGCDSLEGLTDVGEEIRSETGLSSTLCARRRPRILSREQMARYFTDLAETTVAG